MVRFICQNGNIKTQSGVNILIPFYNNWNALKPTLLEPNPNQTVMAKLY